MFENQVEEYIGKALVEEAKGDGEFLNESEIAFRVTGMMYADKIKSDGPVSLRSIKGKMTKVRTMCDEKNLLMLPKIEKGEDGAVEITGWKIAVPTDIAYIADNYFGVRVGSLEATADTEEPQAESAE